MITGVVTAQREAVLLLAVQGPGGQEQEVEVVIDTGFTGFLTLPRSLIAALALTFHSDTVATLGDGSKVALPVYAATTIWNGQQRDVWVLAAEGGSLLGMALLDGFRIVLDVIDGGSVTIEALP